MKISVIIPVYNNAHCVSTAVQSAVNQVDVEKEIIVIDDGSEDNVEDIIKSQFPDVLFLKQDNRGPAAARNSGIKASTGEYLAFLDADDFWESSFLKESSDFLDKHGDCVAVSVGSRFIYTNKPVVVRPKALDENKIPKEAFQIDDFFKFWYEHDHIFTGTCLIRLSAIKKVGLMREDLRISEDLEYWALLATSGKWGFIPHVLWNCNSQNASKKTGWLKKNKHRWQKTPSPETWESRILQSLNPGDVLYFNKYKGKVLLAFIYNMIIGREYKRALITFRSNRALLPDSVARKVYGIAAMTCITWYLFSVLIRFRELNK